TAMPAVVLGTRPLGEADLLVVLLTPEHGKVRAAARHARRSKRRFAGGLTGGAVGQAQLVRRPGSLWRLDGFTPLVDHGAIGRDLTRFAYVAYLCEVTDVLLVEPEADPRLFAALTVALAQTVGQPPDPGVLRWYELALLSALGLLPALSDCAVCGEPVLSEVALSRDSVRFDPRRGGVLCTVHGAGLAHRVGPGNDRGPELLLRSARVVAAAAELHVAAEPPRWNDTGATAPSTAPSTVVRRGLRDLLRDVLRLHLRRPLRALEFFAHLPTLPLEGAENVDPAVE
ncbi:MAG: DNA repair protein RecO, partial [Nannocystaceae bacterium]|nr:DNA repair protein RecO [Nannocystaceae bacterium]